MATSPPSRSINRVAISAILVFVTIGLALALVGLAAAFPVFPFPGIPIVIFIVVYLIALGAVIARKSWGYILTIASMLALLVLFGPEITASLFTPVSDPYFFTVSLIVIAGPILSIPFGIQGFREARGKIPTTPFPTSKLYALALVVFGLVLGGMMAAYIAASSPVGAGVDLAGPPDTFLTIEEQNNNFATKEFTVKKGDNVILVIRNLDNQLHDVTIDELNFKVENPAGKTSLSAFTADQEGTFTFYCSIPGHREAGMEGTIVVKS